MSKGIESLKRIRQETAPNTYNKDFDKDECCNIIEKELKALEIIKEKGINVNYFQKHCDMDYDDEFNIYRNEEILTQAEFDLLKEVLL